MLKAANFDVEVTKRFIIPGTSPKAISDRRAEAELSIVSRDDVSTLINMTCQSVLSQIVEFSQSDESKQINPNLNPLIVRAKYSKDVLDRTRESCKELFPEIMNQPLVNQSFSVWNWLVSFVKSPV